jgi:putative tryptophan/tyrosine transport system substrate-binding protein
VILCQKGAHEAARFHQSGWRRGGGMAARGATLLKLASTARLPSTHDLRRWPEAGALMSYGPDLHDLFRRSAIYVDRILKGTRPADLPVEQPTKFELVINLKTAQVLGLEIPAQLLALTDEVIE